MTSSSRHSPWILRFLGPAILLAPLALVSLPAFAAEHFVTSNSDNTFQPSSLEIVEGDTVTWTNNGGFHNVVADDLSFRCADGCDGQGGNGDPSSSAWTFSIVFSTPGTVGYNCEVHVALGMTGQVIVGPAEVFSDTFEDGTLNAWTAVIP